MKNIVFFSKDLNIGGMEKALVNLLNKLESNYKVTLYLEKIEGTLLNELNKNIIIKEYKTCKSKIIIYRKAKNFLKRFIWTLKNKNKYDFSCAYATYSLIASRLALIASSNSSLYIHSNYHAYYKNDNQAILDFFNSLNYYKFKNIIFVSNEAKEAAYNLLKPRNNFLTINNIVNDKLFYLAQEPIEKVFQKENINLLFVGRLDNESKNFDLMLESLKLALKSSKNIKLYLVGDGPYKNNIKKYVKENNILENVVLLGEKTNPYPYMKECDCLILTSRCEGFPVIYTEALVLNQKVITTFPTSDNYLDVKDYFTCVKSEPTDIAKAILNINKKKAKYEIDFTKYNKQIIKDLTKIIEGSIK